MKTTKNLNKKKTNAGRKSLAADTETKQLGFKAPETIRDLLDEAVEEIRAELPPNIDKKNHVDRSKLLRALVEYNIDDAVDIFKEHVG